MEEHFFKYLIFYLQYALWGRFSAEASGLFNPSVDLCPTLQKEDGQQQCKLCWWWSTKPKLIQKVKNKKNKTLLRYWLLSLAEFLGFVESKKVWLCWTCFVVPPSGLLCHPWWKEHPSAALAEVTFCPYY